MMTHSTSKKRVATTPKATPKLFHQFLVAVDAEGLSDHAVRAGLALAKLFHAKVELLHAVGSPAFDWEYVDDVRAAAANAGIMTTAWEAMTAHVAGLVPARERQTLKVDDLVRVLPGQPAKVILREAEDLKADVIVLGLHKRHGLVDFGSTARTVLAHAPQAVWFQRRPFREIRQVLVPVDMSPDSLSALATACAMAKVLHARVRAVHCFQSTNFITGVWPGYPDFGAACAIDDARQAAEADFERAMNAFDWSGVEHTWDFFDGEPIAKILELAGEADLVVMGTHGRTGLSSILLGNVAYSVMKLVDTPVLAIRHAKMRRVEG
jgi:nucleotide-binding universal stress UspA family protein